ncbi:hypothetical protein CB1_000802001, partial [Camelus ferus]
MTTGRPGQASGSEPSANVGPTQRGAEDQLSLLEELLSAPALVTAPVGDEAVPSVQSQVAGPPHGTFWALQTPKRTLSRPHHVCSVALCLFLRSTGSLTGPENQERANRASDRKSTRLKTYECPGRRETTSFVQRVCT